MAPYGGNSIPIGFLAEWIPGPGRYSTPTQIQNNSLVGDNYRLYSDHNNLHRTTEYRPSIIAPHSFYIYPQCGVTTAAAYINRHRPQTLDEYNPRLFRNTGHLQRFKRHPRRWTREEYADSFRDPGKRRFYSRIASDLDLGRKRVSAGVQPFTKMEKMSTNKYKAPRLIQARNPTFNIEYGRYLKPLERACKDDIHIGKGNFDQIGAKVHKLAKRYKYYTECDHTAFDAHVTVEMLRLTHRFYQSCYPNDRDMVRLASRTIVNHCYTRNGESYHIRGTRMSGDVDTSFGNSLINYYILKDALKQLQIHGDVIVQGDDSIIFSDVPIGQEFVEILRTYNMESKISTSTTRIHTVEYCASKLVYSNSGRPTMAADPGRLRSRYGFCFRPYDEPTYKKYLRAVSHCNWCLTKNTPASRAWTKIENINLRHLRLLEADEIFYLTEESEGIRLCESNIPTPSMIEAYPDYDWDVTEIEYKLPPAQKKYIINHENKEMFSV